MITPPDGIANGRVSVRVPGSTSNLGAGFDAVGLAIGRWLEATAIVTGNSRAVTIRRTGTISALQVPDENDLIWRGFVAACTAMHRPAPIGLEIDARSEIPVGRGLGSSAAAIVAGVLLANAMLDGNLDCAGVVEIALGIESHPDNVAPSVLGGAVLCLPTGKSPLRSVRLKVHPSLRFVFIVPDFEIQTAVARAALPSRVDFATSANGAARAAALVVGLQSGDAMALACGLDDVLHVPFRRSLVRGYDAVTGAAIAQGAIGASLSGSGSAIVAIVTEGRQAAVQDAAIAAWNSTGVDAFAFTSAPEMCGATITDRTRAYSP